MSLAITTDDPRIFWIDGDDALRWQHHGDEDPNSAPSARIRPPGFDRVLYVDTRGCEVWLRSNRGDFWRLRWAPGDFEATMELRLEWRR